MSVIVKELADSRRGSHEIANPWAEFHYTVKGTGTAEEADAYHAVLGVSWPGPELEWPLEDDTTVVLTRLSVGMEPVSVDETADPALSQELYDATVNYGILRGGYPGQPGDDPWPGAISFNTSGGSMRLTQSIKTMGNYNREDNPKPAPDYKGAIGVTKDSVEGVDIEVKAFNFVEVHTRPVLTVEYARILFETTGRWNSSPFRVFDTCELKLDDVFVARRGQGDWEFTFHFAAMPNRTIAGGNPIDIPGFPDFNKRGWDYLWVRHEDEKDDAASKTVLRPTSAHVEQVLYAADFGRLGI